MPADWEPARQVPGANPPLSGRNMATHWEKHGYSLVPTLSSTYTDPGGDIYGP